MTAKLLFFWVNFFVFISFLLVIITYHLERLREDGYTELVDPNGDTIRITDERNNLLHPKRYSIEKTDNTYSRDDEA